MTAAAKSAGLFMTPLPRISRPRRRLGSEERVVQGPLGREIRDGTLCGAPSLGAQRRDDTCTRRRLQPPGARHLDERLVDVVELAEALLHPRRSLGEGGQLIPPSDLAFR